MNSFDISLSAFICVFDTVAKKVKENDIDIFYYRVKLTPLQNGAYNIELYHKDDI